MANLIARIAVLLVLAAAGMVLADRKEKIDLSVSLLLFLAAVNVTSFFSLKDNRIVVVMILTVYFLLYAGAKELLRRRAEKKENECKPNIRAGSRCRAILQKNSIWKGMPQESTSSSPFLWITPSNTHRRVEKSTFSGEKRQKSRIFGAEYLRYPAGR